MDLMYNSTMESFQRSDINLTTTLTDLVTALNNTLIFWCSGSPLFETARNYFISKSTILQFDSVIDLMSFQRAIVFLVFHSLSNLNISNYNSIPNAKTRILLLTNDEEVANEPNYDKWMDKLLLYTRSLLLWFNIYQGKTKILTFSQMNDDFTEITYEEALNYFQVHPRPTKIPNFNGREIFVSALNFSVYSYIAPGDNDTMFVDGTQVLMLQYACKLMNLTPVYVMAAEYGSILPNGTFSDGLIKDVREMKTDVNAAGVYYRPGLMGMLDIVNPWQPFCVRYLVPRPVLLNSSSLVFINVFTMELWVIMVGTVFVCSLFANIIAKMTKNPAIQQYRNFPNGFMAMLFHLLQVKYPTRSEYSGSYVPLLLAWGWLGFIVTTIYNSELAATFTNPFYSVKIQTEEQFLREGFTFGSDQQFELGLLFDLSDPLINKWTKRFSFEKPGERERRLLEGNYVIPGFTYGQIFYYQEPTRPADEYTAGYEVADNCASLKYTGIMFSPGSPYVDGVNLIYGRLTSAGLLQKDEYDMMMDHPLLRRNIPKNVFTMTKDLLQIKSFSRLPFSVFRGIFYFYLCGHAIASVVFCCEIIVNKWYDKLENKKLSAKYIRVRPTLRNRNFKILMVDVK